MLSSCRCHWITTVSTLATDMIFFFWLGSWNNKCLTCTLDFISLSCSHLFCQFVVHDKTGYTSSFRERTW